MKLSRDYFAVETIYMIECPECGAHIETMDNIAYEEEIMCEECHSTFDLIY